MILSDFDINRAISDYDLRIDPFDFARLQPASYDVTLSGQFRKFKRGMTLDPMRERSPATEAFLATQHILYPGEFILGSTIETVALPDTLAARFEGKSSLGRMGLMTHVTAGFIDPGFQGTLTLEIHNVNQNPILLTEGMPIGQLCFTRLVTPASRPYGHASLGSHYQGQIGPTEARTG